MTTDCCTPNEAEMKIDTLTRQRDELADLVLRLSAIAEGTTSVCDHCGNHRAKHSPGCLVAQARKALAKLETAKAGKP